MDLDLTNVTFAYPRREPAVSGVTVSVRAGEWIGLFGPNGSGKTTLLKLAAGLLAPTGGEVSIERRALATLSQKAIARAVCIVMQKVSASVPMTAGEFIRSGRYPHQAWWALSDTSDSHGAAVIERSVGITDTGGLQRRRMAELSGGEFQRVLLARALVQDAPILLIDEFTTFLDPYYQIELLDLLTRVRNECGRTIIVADHGIGLIARYATRVWLMDAGRLIADGSPDAVLTDAALSRLFRCSVCVMKQGDAIQSVDFFRREAAER